MRAKRKAPDSSKSGAPSSQMCCSTRRPEHTPTIRELQAAILARRHLLPPATARLVAELAYSVAESWR